MSFIIGLAAVLWLVAGALVLGDAITTMQRVSNILQQQYLTGQLILGVVLCSFGVVFAALAYLCGKARRY